MKMLIQRVSKASVTVDNKIVGKIGKGLLVFLGVHKDDTETDWLVNKLLNLRIFPDPEGKMNLSVQDIKGEVLIVSQFTLYANCKNGRRPDFIDTAPPEKAEKLYNKFIEEVKKQGISTQTGIFGAHMDVELINDGPVTLIIENNNFK